MEYCIYHVSPHLWLDDISMISPALLNDVDKRHLDCKQSGILLLLNHCFQFGDVVLLNLC